MKILLIFKVILLNFFLLFNANAEKYLYKYSDTESKISSKLRIGSFLTNSSGDYILDSKFSGLANNYFETNVGAEVELNYNISKHFSFSAALGYLPQEKKRLSLSLNNQDVSETGRFAMIPISLGAKIFMAPYSSIRPYFGAGYHYSFVSSSIEFVEFDNVSGFYVQAGADWWWQKNLGMVFDVKYYSMDIEADLTKAFNNNLKAEFEPNPVFISAGITYRFD